MKFPDIFNRRKIETLSKEIQEMRDNTFAQSVMNGSIAWPFGTSVNKLSALRIATWFACLQVRWDAVAMLPANVYQAAGKKKEVASQDPRQYLVHTRPNPMMTATQFWKVVQQQRDNYGNSYGLLKRAGGKIIRIDLVAEPNEMQIFAKDELYYRHKNVEYPSTDVLHFKGYTMNGKIGLSLTEFHAATVGRLQSIHKYSTRSVSNPGMYATTTNNLPMGDAQKTAFKDYLEKELTGWGETGQMPVLYNGFDIKTAGINPKDAQYLNQINATKEDIYAITKVPPRLAQNYQSGNTYSNAEQQSLDFLTWTMTVTLKDIEDEMNYKMFTTSEQGEWYFKFNEKALLRTDAATQVAWFKGMFELGAYTINDILGFVDMNPIEGGDEHYVPGNNLVPIRLLEQLLVSRKAGAPATEKKHLNGNSVPVE